MEAEEADSAPAPLEAGETDLEPAPGLPPARIGGTAFLDPVHSSVGG